MTGRKACAYANCHAPEGTGQGFETANGARRGALYTFERGEDGTWRIAGCVLLAGEGEGGGKG